MDERWRAGWEAVEWPTVVVVGPDWHEETTKALALPVAVVHIGGLAAAVPWLDVEEVVEGKRQPVMNPPFEHDIPRPVHEPVQHGAAHERSSEPDELGAPPLILHELGAVVAAEQRRLPPVVDVVRATKLDPLDVRRLPIQEAEEDTRVGHRVHNFHTVA